jgi:NADP-dependent aldehyde dehydrogenase
MSTQSIDPRTGQEFGPVLADSDDQQVRATCLEAEHAAPFWASLALQRRAEVMELLADTLDAAESDLVPLADSETALGSVRLTGELARTTFQLRLLAGAVRAGTYAQQMFDEAVAGAPPQGHPELRRLLVPIGPVAVYAASNFPFAFSVAGGDTASALAAGCPVVVKAHPGHPQTSEAVLGLLRGALTAAGVPVGVIGMVRGFSAGTTLIQDPAIRAAAFTGSRGGGRALFDLASSRPEPIPFYGELGSVNPVVVLASAVSRPDLARDYVDSLLLGAGQFCTNPSVLFVPAGSGLVETITAELSGRPAGLLLHGGVVAALDSSLAEVMAAPGVSVLAGEAGQAAVSADSSLSRGPLLLGTTALALAADRTPLEVECFGPAGLLVEYDTTVELRTVLASMEGALVGCVFGEADDPAAPEVIVALAGRVGRLAWNAWPTGVAVSPAQHHGGPWPSTTSPLYTSVGVTAIPRFLRPLVYQSLPEQLIPATWATPEAPNGAA